MYSKGTHHMAPPSRTLLSQGKAIPTAQHGMNWVEKSKMKDKTGKAHRRRTMSNRGEGTGMAGKASPRVRVPKVTRSGHFPLWEERG